MFFLPNIKPLVYKPNIGSSNLSFVRVYDQGVLTGFYGIFDLTFFVLDIQLGSEYASSMKNIDKIMEIFLRALHKNEDFH